ncbi:MULTISPECIES: DapH/DapD/GlmU-related protein [Aeromonas]|uniref:DapH/DapD/GlmU-related protein n=1 Tax=Aeromonas TaxID=642 RepID=UPI0022E4CFF5|nr:DapH/DapD/GlmU-related protein [Aeromonas sp. QDB54]
MNYYKHYGFWGGLNLFICKLYTIIFFNRSKIIRLPFECRGKRLVDFGVGLSTGRYCRIEAYDSSENHNKLTKLSFGRDCQINDSVHIVAADKVEIGNNVLIASRVFISDLNHGSYSGDLHSHPDSFAAQRSLSTSPVIIYDNVWIGEGVVILPGVKIGQSSIIGANAVVTKDIPDYSIAVGNPARVIKKYNFSSLKWEGAFNGQ